MKKLCFKSVVAYMFLLAGIISCEKSTSESVKKENDTLPEVITPDPVDEPLFTKTVNWNNRSDGAYSTSNAISDLGTLTGWKEARTIISGNTLRLKIEKNALSSTGGMVANIDVESGSEYEVQFKVKFHSEFDWSKGGKVGFGFRIGDGNTGCDKADDGNGASARLMWYTSNGNTIFKPYLYYKDMPDDCGDNLVSSAKYPASGSIQKGVWYTVKIYVKSNTASNKDGRVKFTVDTQTILDQPIRWTTNDSKRLINKLSFSTFRGGSTSDWESDTDGYIYFDDLTWTRLK
jgi:hypothetical protein